MIYLFTFIFVVVIIASDLSLLLFMMNTLCSAIDDRVRSMVKMLKYLNSTKQSTQSKWVIGFRFFKLWQLRVYFALCLHVYVRLTTIN